MTIDLKQDLFKSAMSMAGAAPEPRWFLATDEGYLGPLAEGDVRDMLALGDAGADAFAWQEGMADWARVRGIEAFAREAALASSGRWVKPGRWRPRLGPIAPARPAAATEAPLAGAGRGPASPMAQANLGSAALVSALPTNFIEKGGAPAPAPRYSAAGAWAAPLAPLRPSPRAYASMGQQWWRPWAGGQARSRQWARAWPLAMAALAALALGAAAIGWRAKASAARDDRLAARLPPELFARDKKRLLDAVAAVEAATESRPRLLLVKRQGAIAASAFAASSAAPGATEPATGAPGGPGGPENATNAPGGRENGTDATDLWVAARFPEGEELRVRLSGVPATLLGAFRGEFVATAQLREGLAQVGPLSGGGGEPLPSGNYKVEISCPRCRAPEDRQPLARETIFLGARGPAYASGLAAYHLRLRDQARAEARELMQVCDTLEHQLGETTAYFSAVRQGGPGRAGEPARQKWQKFSERWLGLQGELGHVFEHWTSAALSAAYYYPGLYALAREAGALVLRVHQEQGTLLAAATPEAQGEALGRVQADAAVAQSALLTIRAKGSLAAGDAVGPDGMPPRLDASP